MTPPGSRAEQAWRTCFAQAILILAAGTICLLAFLLRAPTRALPSLVMMATGALAGFILIKFKKNAPTALSNAVFLTSTAIVLGAIWANQVFYVQTHIHFEPFTGNKILALAIGLLAPPVLWVGLTAILATGIVPMVQFMTFPQELRQGLPFQEPWATLIYIVMATVIYILRFRSFEAQLNAARAETRVALLQEFSHLLINAQHLANTPLQTLENSITLLRTRDPEQRELISVIERSLARLRKIVLLFSHCDSHINWKEMELPNTAEEFEARLKELLGKAFP